MTHESIRTWLALHAAVFVAVVGGWMYGGGFEFAGVSDNAWWTPFMVINLGIFLGNLAMALLARQPGAEHTLWIEGRKQDLSDSRRIVVEQLRQLEAEQDKHTPEDYAREREALLAVGSQAARQLQEQFPSSPGPATVVTRTVISSGGWTAGGTQAGEATSPASSPPTMGPQEALAMRLRLERDADPRAFEAAMRTLGLSSSGGISGEMRGAMYTLGVLGLIAGLYTMASQDARSRAPGMSMTGGDGVASPSMNEAAQAPAAAADPTSIALQQQLEANPDDLDALNQLTEISLLNQDMSTALDLNMRARKVAPDDPDAGVFHGVLLAMIDRREEAYTTLDGILQTHPDHLRALVWRSLLALGDDPSLAVTLMERAVALDPDPRLTDLLARARERAGAVGGAPAPAPAPAEAPPVLVSGTIELAEGANPEGQLIFVSLKNAARPGPPMAAVKLPPGPFPLLFEVTAKDLIPMAAQGPLPATVQLTVRLDSDGDPMTRPDTDPSAVLSDLAPGTTGVTLQLE